MQRILTGPSARPSSFGFCLKKTLGLLAVLIVSNAACVREVAPDPDSKDSGDQTSKPSSTEEPAKARDPNFKPPAEGLVLWLHEQAGFLPAELAAKSHKYPLLFALYSDGRLEYRTPAFEFYRVQLKDDERQALVQEALSLEVDSDVELPELPYAIADAGLYRMGIDWESHQRAWELEGGAPFYVRQLQTLIGEGEVTAKGDVVEVGKRLAQLHDRLAKFEHPRAERYEP